MDLGISAVRNFAGWIASCDRINFWVWSSSESPGLSRIEFYDKHLVRKERLLSLSADLGNVEIEKET